MQTLPYSIDWQITNRVLIIRITGDISAEQLAQLSAEAFEHIRKASCPIHAIVDLQRLSVRPQTIQEAVRNAGQRQHKNQGTSVIVTPPMHPVVKFICSAVMTTLQLKYDICDSLDEAHEKIAKLEAKRKSAGAS